MYMEQYVLETLRDCNSGVIQLLWFPGCDWSPHAAEISSLVRLCSAWLLIQSAVFVYNTKVTIQLTTYRITCLQFKQNTGEVHFSVL